MKWCAYDSTGAIVQTGIGLAASPEEFTHLPFSVILDIPDEVSDQTHYYHDGMFREFGEQPDEAHVWDWTTHAWIVSPTWLEEVRTKKAKEIDGQCKATILAGFESSALGASHHYPAKMTDQQNLASSVLDSLLPNLPVDWMTPFWCADANAVWEFRLHTAEQIQQVGRDAKTAVLVAMGKNEVLQAQVAAATSLETLNAIQW